MIDINLKAKGKSITDNIHIEDVILNEVALMIYKLEEIKKELLGISFDRIEIEENE